MNDIPHYTIDYNLYGYRYVYVMMLLLVHVPGATMAL